MVARTRVMKWAFLVAGAAAMGAAGTFQFVWSSIRPALGANLAMSGEALGTVFTLFIICQTLSQFPAGWFRDRFGPRVPLALAAVLMTAGYLGIGYATAGWQVYLSYAVGGIGAGTAFTVGINTPVKWFEHRRGLATGFVTMAYGGASVLFIPYVRLSVSTDLTATMTALAAVIGGATFLGVFVLRDPETDGDTDEGATIDPASAYSWREAIRTWQFWLLYAMMIVVNGVGLMVIGKAVSYAEHFGLAAWIVTATASVVAVADSIGIVTIGGLSDRFDRVRTLAVSLTLSGVVTALSVWAGQAQLGLVFVGLIGLSRFLQSPVFAITPVLVGEYYGPARSSENYGALYSAKVWGGVGGGVAASVLIGTIGWENSFIIGGVALSAVGLLVTQLRPVERPAT